jgi:very-short-patch-repair endonuclease
METRTRLLLVAANLPCPVVNEVVWAPDGEYVKRVDMLYPQHKIAIEYDGDQHRTDQAQWRDDIRRRRWLEALGWTVIVVVADDIIRDQARLIERVRAAIEAAERR